VLELPWKVRQLILIVNLIKLRNAKRLVKYTSGCVWGCFQRQLDPEGSGPMNGLVHWQIQIWIDFWEVVGLRRK
jgi:hypothetical protein